MTTSEDLKSVDGHAYAGHANRDRTVLLTKPRRSWSFRDRWSGDEPRERRPGMRLIGTGAVLLVLLGAGLLAVSYAAQYAYVLHERGQVTASVIEAGALDVGMIIFSLIALGLALAGLGSKVERAGIIACAVASAVMNFAPADSSSWRSVLAWSMPPIFLAFVVDRVVSAVRRHVLGMQDGHSPWAAVTVPVCRIAKGLGMAALYSLRFVLAPPSTAKGMRLVVLTATPLPESRPVYVFDPQRIAGQAPAITAAESKPPAATCLRCGKTPPWGTVHVCPVKTPRAGTKTFRFLELVRKQYGELGTGSLAQFPLTEVSRVASVLGPEVDLDTGQARKVLRAAVLEAQGEGR